MFQLAMYAAIVVLTRHKIPIVSGGGEKRGRERFEAPLCDVNSPRVSVACGGTLNFPQSRRHIHRASL